MAYKDLKVQQELPEQQELTEHKGQQVLMAQTEQMAHKV